MKFLKYLLFAIIAIVLIYLLLCLVGPKSMDTDRSLEMQSSPKIIYNLVNDLEKWESWSAWAKQDTTMVMEYGDKTTGVGASYSWVGESGKGNLEILESEMAKSLKTKLEFEGWDGYSNGNWTFEPSGNKTKVSWGFVNSADLPFMFRGMAMVMGMKNQMKTNMDEGLAGIKAIAEERAKGIYNGMQVTKVALEEKHYLMNRQNVKMEKIQQFYATNLGGLFAKVQAAKAEMDGMPCGLFFKWNEANGTTDMAAAIPMKEATDIEGGTLFSMPGGTALQIDYVGPYDKTAVAHYAMDEFMKDHGLLNDAPVIEEYVTDPGDEPDPNKLLTRVTYYLAK